MPNVSRQAVIKDTFKLDAIPKEAIRIGLAGVIPYLVTSTATVVCAFEMNAAVHTGSGFLMDASTAEALLHVLEPIQIGYGAVVRSTQRTNFQEYRLTSIDSIVPRNNPLGTGVGRLRW